MNTSLTAPPQLSRRSLIGGVCALPVALLPSGAQAADIDWSGMMVTAFEQISADLQAIQAKASQYQSTTSWRVVSNLDVAGVGGGACAIPMAAYATLPAEFLYLMREIYSSAMGIGFIVHGQANKDDFANILGVWSDAVSLDNQTMEEIYTLAEDVTKDYGEDATEYAIEHVAKRVQASSRSGATPSNSRQHAGSTATIGGAAATGVKAGTAGSTPASTKVVSKVLAKKAGTKVAGKLSTKVAAKTGTKIAAKYAAKASVGWIPFVSAAACAGLNVWIMDGILDASEKYYARLHQFRTMRYRVQLPR